jgi:hypothetical protein
MTRFKFTVGKEESLQIIREILSHLKTDRDVSCNYDMPIDLVNNEPEYDVVPYRHKLAVVEVLVDAEDFEISKKLSDHYSKLMNSETYTERYGYNRLTWIKIYKGDQDCQSSITSDSEILLKARGISDGGNDDYALFRYDSTLQCWLIVESDVGGEEEGEGLNDNGFVTILDFNDYF